MLKSLVLSFLFVSSVFAGNKAVVIIDMQYGFYSRGGANQSDELIQLVRKQKELLSWAKNENLPILFFEYDGYQETDFALTSVLWGYKFKKITKYDDNAFSGRSRAEANQYFESLDVDSLIIAGINASGCVQRTVVGALGEGYKVQSAADIVADMYRYPPVYPQSAWFPQNADFKGFENVEQLLKSFL